jgi:outer membrane protein OmpA-like peptidoglycan-associated protein
MAHQVKLLGLLGLLLAACTALPPDKTEALGPVFNEDAKQGYVALAGSTWDAGDWDFIHFDRKAEQAMLGDEVWPDRVASRLMPASARETMLVERARLVDALEASARRQSPREAAKAQVSFDCWLGEVGASRRADLSTGCKETFMAELAKVEARQRDVPDMYAVFFETGSALLSVPGRNTITDAVRASRLLDAQRIDVVGSADAAGPARSNEVLANERALAVVEGLLQAGVPAEMISTGAAGPAAGGADAALDRRVDITIVR